MSRIGPNEEDRNGPPHSAPESEIFRAGRPAPCGRLDPGVVIRPELGEWHPRMPDRLDEEELADWRAGRDAIYQLAALTVGARLAVSDN